LIADLASKNGIVRVKARRRLVACRAQSVPQLMKALSDEKDWVRWEAAKALSQIGNAASARALLKALSDERFEVRWLAAEGLIRIGRRTIVPLLEAAVSHSDSQWWREGIHHVLHDLNKGRLVDVLRPVLSALEGPEPSIEAPVAAKSALDTLKRKS
jgi:HEAT repeat protein